LIGIDSDFGLDSDSNHKGWQVNSIEKRLGSYYPKVQEAYHAARSARFEHGESGAPNKVANKYRITDTNPFAEDGDAYTDDDYSL
jgi:hypothetical protein